MYACIYYYKTQEYSDFYKIKEDIGWRELDEIEKWVSAIAWIPLACMHFEKERIFQNRDTKEE